MWLHPILVRFRYFSFYSFPNSTSHYHIYRTYIHFSMAFYFSHLLFFSHHANIINTTQRFRVACNYNCTKNVLSSREVIHRYLSVLSCAARAMLRQRIIYHDMIIAVLSFSRMLLHFMDVCAFFLINE